ncbi:hypothetical protein CO112_00925 [Candidatus Dojkabacteria bacterium CG_4_9_14_3_um_filter_150_Dojkabacteria_WS6_41_13]|uniref:Uncharacterized protein n=1 Tax=Candidatus Dojkabacteria bacterium CG_4_10_14_0_2_um_filter_Dojkabacteria_WS6_41_15 TaxID=2014249 RepID=A0A2M7W2L3_9BACT|nr:MAG: hypothetical protein COZ14_01100 [Candidatus Dojkabacteria bacterium CG_4_10_14_3_um_filter_Dojkabacteria_WS6_41_9]PJA15021.1 MAG: hypothetical protein COX64_01370 [Candidatus Dojkabacteria bacterium CG_4_10_14_0_2_um_filter_Dojkabacteria_WS6_41_15]PJB23455.1 MAG: hypothetical protein CO112_00925 [Candidatus Dojkabacteria bacterium CG_4_9_14_3_um_filter_150_Dojkabacteria_WS6_41_13]
MDITPRCGNQTKSETYTKEKDPDDVLRMWNWQKMRHARRRIMQCHHCGAQSLCNPEVKVSVTGKVNVDEKVTLTVTPHLR